MYDEFIFGNSMNSVLYYIVSFIPSFFPETQWHWLHLKKIQKIQSTNRVLFNTDEMIICNY